jgi:hypothetical protein
MGRYSESNVAFRHPPEAAFEDPSGCTTHQRPFNAVSISTVEANPVTKGRFGDAGRACLAMCTRWTCRRYFEFSSRPGTAVRARPTNGALQMAC